ncbi:V-type ATP synthase subunit E [Brassicibacter mesophilus]|uniref:V-type ATP synthase subunit E n=1 Tax=Brassicibacter mesophilus TaxID=745119 RepID=UPI003D20676A
MITVEKKLNIFSKLILEKEQNESDTKLQEMKKNNEKIIQDHKEKIEEKARHLINNRVSKANVEKNTIISKVTSEAKNKILAKKKELLDRTIEGIKNKAKQFTDMPEYEIYLMNSVSEVLSALKGEQGVSMYLLQKDTERFNEKLTDIIIQNGFNQSDIEIMPTTYDIIGGVFAENKTKTIRIDATIKTVIEDNKSTIGQILYEELKKAGGKDE